MKPNRYYFNNKHWWRIPRKIKRKWFIWTSKEVIEIERNEDKNM